MNISEVGKLAGLPPKTIRFYEDIGLIAPRRMANGYRVFSAQDLHRLAFLRRARALGFGIDECRVLLALHADPDRASAQVKAVAHVHLARIDAQLRDLTEMRATLTALVVSCAGDDRPDCPILDDLAQDVTSSGAG